MTRGRKPQVIPNQHFHITLPMDLAARMKLLLWSDLEGRVPQGAMQSFLSERLRDYFDNHKPLDVSKFLGEPDGTHVVLGSISTLAALLLHLKGSPPCELNPSTSNETSSGESETKTHSEGASHIPTTRESESPSH